MFRRYRIESLLLVILASGLLYSCGVKSTNLIEKIKGKKIITIYTRTDTGVKDRYLFKIKEDRVTLMEKHGDRIHNKTSKNLALSQSLENFIIEASDNQQSKTELEYIVKCGIEECSIYPTPSELKGFQELLTSFSTDSL